MVELMRTGGYSGQVDLNRILGQSKMANITSLVVKLIDDSFLDENGKIKNDLKFNINNPTFKIQNSKFLKNPDDKYDTMLFLPEGEDRKGEGGLRTKGYFKFSYKKVDDKWFICDFYGNIIKEAPENIQQKIKDYINSLDENQNINDLPLITIITVVFNGAKTLEETIQSVINQTYPNVEYIIIDGGSTDGTLDIIKKYEYYIDYWVSEKDKGIYDAMNKGVVVSVGMWIGILGSDDFLEYDALENFYLHSCLDADCDVIYGNSRVLLDNKILYTRISSNSIDDITKCFIFFHPDSLAKIKVYKGIGMYDTTFKLAADYEFFLRAYFEGYKFCKVNKIVLNYRIGGFSSNYKRALDEKIKIYIKYKSKLTTIFLTHSIYEFIKSYIKDKLNLKEDSIIVRFYRMLKYGR
jgi:glycosyltransferase involved in cell wall biosynthesis